MVFQLDESEMSFTLAQIKSAFYAKFNQTGNKYFRYLGNEGKFDDRTDKTWQEFIKKLENIK